MNKNEALKLALEYMNECLEEHDAKYQRHPATEAGRNNILDDIEIIKEALAHPWPDLTEQQRESYQKGHNDGVAHHKQAVKAAQPEREPVMGTKTWFEDGKVVTQHLTAKDIYKEPEQEPVVCCGDYATCMKPCTPRGRWLAEQEPVAWMTINEYGEEDDIHYENPEGHLLEGWTYKPLYTHPPTVQPEKEPFEYWNAVEGWVKIEEVREHFDSVGCGTIYKTAGEDRVPVYTAPPKREWADLTDKQKKHAEATCMKHGLDAAIYYVQITLKEKNT